MSQEIDLLTKLHAFYSKRYKGTQLEEKFNAAVYDLVKTGDVQKSTYMEFCVEHDIEPQVERETSSTCSCTCSCKTLL